MIDVVAAYIVLAGSTAFAVYMAGRHPAQCALCSNLPYEEDDVSDVYQRDILPDAEKNHSAIIKSLRDTAMALGRMRPGGITSADVLSALKGADSETYMRLQNTDPRLMGAVFQRSAWMQTGEFRSTGSHGRRQPVWVLKAPEAA